MLKAKVIGAGLAGCEAAWQLANAGIYVELTEMKPVKYSPAHSSPMFAELVCSNSFKNNGLESASGLLKEELRHLGSVVMACADETSVPAGNALAVDRRQFSELLTDKIKNNKMIEIITRECVSIPDEPVIIATGPLTPEPLSEAIKLLEGKNNLHFYDAAAPVIIRESIDESIAFYASRYDKGTPDYINCPMDEDEYNAFYDALISAERAELHSFDKDEKVYEGCMPVEIMATRGRQTLLFGPLKPVGLTDKRTNRKNHAVVQLRRDSSAGDIYGMVGFQTNLKFEEQKRVFRMIPGLQNAEFVRFGVMHRNTYLQSPGLLSCTYAIKTKRSVYFAGQITGVEGYIESVSSGLVAGINLAAELKGSPPVIFPRETAVGSLAHYASSYDGKDFQPMGANFGIIPTLEQRIRDKRERYLKISQRALEITDCIKKRFL